METTPEFGLNAGTLLAQFVNFALVALFVGFLIYLICKWIKGGNEQQEQLDRIEKKIDQLQDGFK